MIEYMKELRNVRILKKDNHILLFNDTNMNSVIIHKDIFELVKDLKEIEEFDKIIDDYNSDDQKFLLELKNVLKVNRIFEDCSATRISRINYIITDFCNLKCKHCCYSAFHIDDGKGYNINKELVILDKIISINPDELVITGGEPLVINNFDEVIKRLNKSTIAKRILSTNGTLITEKNVEIITECFNAFDISLDGITQEKCDMIRGEGTYNKVINAIKLLKKHGSDKISLSYAMSIDVENDRSDFENFCKELGVTPIVRQMSSVGRALENKIDCKDQKEDYFYNMLGQFCNCTAAKSEITVNRKGEVFPCINFLSSDYKIGMISDMDILNKVEWNKKQTWYQNFSNYVSFDREECRECEVNMICWHCPFQVKTYMDVSGTKQLAEVCDAKKDAMWRRLWNEA